MTQKERQERSRKEIYQAALEEFGTYGYDKVNMERICGNHGISKGMMYHYYSGKDDLFLLCAREIFQALGPCGTGYGPSVRGGYGSRSQRFLHDPGALFPASSPAKARF